MRSILRVAAIGLFASALSGCASTWDKVSSNKFWDRPGQAVLNTDDPMQVLRTKAEGNERAAAMRRLQEPARRGGSPQEQSEALQILEQAATADPSPVIRVAAIEALGRFTDPRSVPILISAYNAADGALIPTPDTAASPIQRTGAHQPIADPLGLGAPVGFDPNIKVMIRIRTLDSLARFRQPESIAFLSRVAQGQLGVEGASEDRNILAAAARCLGQIHDKEAVIALTKVLHSPYAKDVAIAHHVQAGLQKLTGKELPPDPQKWDEVVRAGFEVKPPPNVIQRAVNTVLP